jgi:hypothetical protein
LKAFLQDALLVAAAAAVLRGRGTTGQPLAVRWIMVHMVTATCGNMQDRSISPDYPAMVELKADSTGTALTCSNSPYR